MAIESPLHRVFCENVRALRRAKGLTQQETAKRLDLSTPAYNEIENGRYAPSLSTIERVAAALGVSPADLLNPKKIASPV